MPSKKTFPKTLMVYETTTIADDPIMLCAETPEDISEEFADQPVAVYQLLAIGRLSVEKQVDARVVQKFDIKLDKPKKKISVGRRSR